MKSEFSRKGGILEIVNLELEKMLVLICVIILIYEGNKRVKKSLSQLVFL